MKVLVTGGAGFIGSHIVDALIKLGYEVTIYDNLYPQVHGHTDAPPSYLNPDAEFIKADMRDKDKLSKVLKGVDIIFHEAAVVGVGQSMYEIYRYVENNVQGTANLLDIIVNQKNKIQKIIVASSMSVYGEGTYQCKQCGVVYPNLRSHEQLQNRDWEQKCPKCSMSVKPIPTNEDKPIFPTSIYSITKRDQEDLCLTVCRAYRIPCVALRYFNIYGPRQSISNPYTGVLAIFLSRIKNKKPLVVFEDGLQTRDFIHVSDVVKANLLSLRDEANYEIFNVGTGKATNLLEIISFFTEVINIKIKPRLTNKYRQGDIRHCFADTSKIRDKLGFMPSLELKEGIKDLCRWAEGQAADDQLTRALGELNKKGLII
jgi:dTDP-L-rhamnose 4-epimerase